MHRRLFLNESPTPVPFGKYEGHSVEWVVENDRSYAEWLVDVAEDWLQKPLEEKLGRTQD